MITVVTGLPRSGSTLAMEMLVAGGLPASPETGEGMEDLRALWLPGRSAWLAALDACCIKILDPVIYRPPAGPHYRFVLMTRDPAAQARSQALAAKTIGMDVSPAAEQALAYMIAGKMHGIRSVLRDLGAVCEVPFDGLVRDPARWASIIARFVGLDGGADQMASMVKRAA